MSRNFGVMSGRLALGGTSDEPSAGDAKQYNRADSNVVELFPSAGRAPRATDADKNLAALWFSLAFLACLFGALGGAVTILLLFF